jgi:riboflavin synthase
MFTGLIEEVGVLSSRAMLAGGAELSVRCKKILQDLSLGDSIAVNGVCLTVAKLHDDGFSADLSPETTSRTTLGRLPNGALLNLERPLRLSDRLGGHLVQGHIDGLGIVKGFAPSAGGKIMSILAEKESLQYIVPKGSIAVDGVSLTVVEVQGDGFTVSLIPSTLSNTNFKRLKIDDAVNLEVDIISKYVAKMLKNITGYGKIDEQFLRQTGFLGE